MKVFLLIILIVDVCMVIFEVGKLYGISRCKTFGSFLKEEWMSVKSAAANLKVEATFLKQHPLCDDCTNCKATHMFVDVSPKALCDSCYKKAMDKKYEDITHT